MAPSSRRRCPEMMRDSVDLPAPLAPRSACVCPAASTRLAPASAFVPAKNLVMSRASSRKESDSVIDPGATERPVDISSTGRTTLLQFVGEHRFLDRRQYLVDVLAGRDHDRHQDLLF